ncbi:unnamed protein product [Closterium sp. NIES-54]
MPGSGGTHRNLGAPGDTQATEAALRSVWQPARLPTALAGAKNVSAGTNTPRPPTPSVPLTKLLGRRGFTGTCLLLALATTKASTLRGSTSTSSTAAATSTTAAAASTAAATASTTPTAATEAPTPATTPTSTATTSASSTASTAAPTVPSTTLAPLALAVAAPPTRRRRSPDLRANEVNSSSRSNRGEKGDRGTPLKERAGVTSAEVSNEVSDCGKGGKVREQERQHEAAEGSSGRGGVARYYSVIQRLSSLVLAKVRTLRRRQVTTNSKASNNVTSGPLRANRTVSSGDRCRRDTGRVIEKGYSVLRVTLKKELQLINPLVKVNRTPLSIQVEDLVSHLRASDARNRAAAPANFLDKNQPPMFITLYFIVTRLLDSLRSVRDQFLSLDPTSLTIDLLEQHLLAAETSAVAVGAARGTPHPPFFEGCSPSPLALSVLLLQTSLLLRTSGLLLLVRSAAAARARVAGLVEVAAVVVEVAAGVVVGATVEVVAAVGLVEGVGALVAAMEAAVGVAAVAAVGLVAAGLALGVLVQEVANVSSSGVEATPSCPSSFVSGFLQCGASGDLRAAPHSAPLLLPSDDAWRAEFGDDVELPRWADLLRSRIALFDLDFDAILSAMYALSVSTEGDCYRCVPPDPGIATAALGASESGTLPGQVAASCSCRLLSHETLLWHHRVGHPSLPRLRGKHSRLLVSSLPRSLPSLPPSPAPPCLPCVEGRQRAAPHSWFPPMAAPLQTLHMDVWGPARVSGQSCVRYFLLVVNEYTRYTTVFPLRSKGQVVDVLIPWIRTVRLQLRERFGQDLPVLRLHSDRGGHHGGRSYLHDPCGCSPFYVAVCGPVRCASAQPLAPCLLAEDLAHTALDGEGLGSGSGDLVPLFAIRLRTSSPPVLSPAVFLGFVPDAPGWQFHHPTSRRLCSSQDATFDESVPFDRRFPYRSAPPPPLPLFLAPAPPPGAGCGGAEPGGEEPGGAEPMGVDPAGAEPGGAESEGAESGGVEPRGAASSGAGGTGDAGARGDGVTAGATGYGSARPIGTGTGGAGAGGAGAAGAGAVDPRARGTGDTVWPRLYFVPLLQQRSSERCEPASRPILPVRTARRVPRSRLPPVPGMHAMELRPSSVPLRVPLPAPPESSLPEVPDPASDRARAASPTNARLFATAVTDPSFESATASALVAELLHFAAACRFDYATALIAESESASPMSVGGECALGTDVLEDRQEDFECLAAAVPRFASMLLAPEGDPDAPDIPTALLRRGDYGVKRPSGSPPAFKARYVARSFSQRQGVLQRFGFQFSSQQPTPLSTSYSLSTSPSYDSVELSGPYPELVGCLITLGMGLVLGGRGPVVLTGHADASWELRWLTYLLTDLGEQPRSPPVLYVDNKAMIALCQEHRLERRTKHIALRYFLARELQQRGQLRLVYVATRANTADIFTKALPPSDHQRFSTVLGLVPTLPHLRTA